MLVSFHHQRPTYSAQVDVVFYHGITMQLQSNNRSNYAMCIANPDCISKTFSGMALCEIIDTVATRTGTFLDIVNYNVEVRIDQTTSENSVHVPLQGQQYVCAGELVALQT